MPHSWPGSTLASATKPVSAIPVSEPITAGEGGAGNLVGGMPVGGTGAARGAATGPRYGFKPTIMARPLPAGYMPVGGTGAARGAATGPRYGFKPTIMARPLPAG